MTKTLTYAESQRIVGRVVAKNPHGNVQRDLVLLAAVALSEAASWSAVTDENQQGHASPVAGKISDACAALLTALSSKADRALGLSDLPTLGVADAREAEARAAASLFEAAWLCLSSNTQRGEWQGLADEAAIKRTGNTARPASRQPIDR